MLWSAAPKMTTPTTGSGNRCARTARGPRRRAAEECDELAPPDFEHRLPPGTELSKLGRSQPLCARLKGYHPEGAADRLLHSGISAPSADGFMAEMGHQHT